MPDLGTFSISLAVRDLATSRAFYERLGFEVSGGDEESRWLMMRCGDALIGLFQRMFERNIITFNPPDARAVHQHLSAGGIETELLHEMPDTEDPAEAAPAESDTGPVHLMLEDPDGNSILLDQF
jgi:catechol 2,3-dioxygenase-like lactoylglutathione lyase family enzyme